MAPGLPGCMPCFPRSLPDTPSPLTMHLLLQVTQIGRPCKDVSLATQTVPKGVDATGDHIVEHTARGEDVHRAGLGPESGT